MRDPSSQELEQLTKQIEEMGDGTFWTYLGCKLNRLDDGHVEIGLDVQAQHLNHMGIMHGGVHATLLDSAMGLVAMASRPGQCVVTTNLNVHYAAPIRPGTVTVHAEIVHSSRNLLTAQGKIFGSDGQFCSLCTGTFRIQKQNVRG